MSKIIGKTYEVLATIFLPKWNTTCLLCKGAIFIKIQGVYIQKKEVRTRLAKGMSEQYYSKIELLFDEVKLKHG